MTAAARAHERRRAPRSSDPRPSHDLPPTTLASRRPALRTRLYRMPRWLRIFITTSAFAIFFVGTSAIGIVAGLYYRFRPVREEDRWRFTRSINARLLLFTAFMRDLGLLDYWPPALPPGFEGRAFLLIANHPTLIDVVLILHSLPQLSAVVKASWYRSFVMGPMLRRTEYVPGPGHEGDEDDDELPVVRRIEERLKKGVPVLVFPEGTRSAATKLRRFRRGGIEAAIRAGVPILPLFIANDQPVLMKGIPFWRVPARTCGFTFEWLEPIETDGTDLGSREITRVLADRYEARFAALLEERASSGDPTASW